MRWIAFITIAVLFCSCTALKPVISKKTEPVIAQRSTQPVFIDHISINPSSSNQSGSLPAAEKYISQPYTADAGSSSIEALDVLRFKYAIIMNIPVEALSITSNKLLPFIEEWYGTPYHFGGNSKSGIDCSAFTGNLMSSVFGVDIPRMAKDQYKYCQHVSKTSLEEGDLVFFHTTRKGISHVGVYLGNNKFVHASLNYGVTISDLGDGYYARRLVAAGRIKQNNASVSAN